MVNINKSVLAPARIAHDSAHGPNVCYVVSHGFAARMVLHSELLGELRKREIEVSLLVPKDAVPSLAEFEAPGVRIIGVEFSKRRIHTSFGNAKRYLREPVKQNAALWSRHLFMASGSAGIYASVLAHLNYLGHLMLYRVAAFHRAFDRIDKSVHRSASVRSALKTLRPSLVVSTYPVTALEVATILEAQAFGIPTVGHLLSWDNITCKGRFTAIPDWFISWGPIMTAELKEHYGIERSRVHDCGVPHFDAHRNLVNKQLQNATLVRLGLDADKPYLFFGMSAPIFAPHEIDIVEWLADQIRNDAFGPELQLIIRPHPQNVRGNMADESWLPRLKALRGPKVALNLPILREGGLDWDMETEDLAILVNLLHGCSICLNSGSTLSIDALAHSKPVIVTMFDADKKLPWWKSARRIRDYPHYQKLIRLGGLSPVASYNELQIEIHRYIQNPNRLADSRDYTIQQECSAIDGKSSQRVADALGAILQLSQGASAE